MTSTRNISPTRETESFSHLQVAKKKKKVLLLKDMQHMLNICILQNMHSSTDNITKLCGRLHRVKGSK